MKIVDLLQKKHYLIGYPGKDNKERENQDMYNI
jgi:hypothetical protein